MTIEIEVFIEPLHRKLDLIMADLTNLNAAIGELNTEVAAVQTYIGTLNSGDDQAGVDEATASVTAAVSTLTGLVPAPTPPADTPPADGTDPSVPVAPAPTL